MTEQNMKSGRKELCTLIYKWRRTEYILDLHVRTGKNACPDKGIFIAPPWYYLEYFDDVEKKK